MRSIAVSLASVLLFAGSFARAQNVVVILADDLGYYDCSLYAPNAWHPTTALNRIAADGCVFERAYACPLCSASRASLLTGRSSATTGLTDASGHIDDAYVTPTALTTGKAWSPSLDLRSASRLKAGYVTLAEAFEAKGYATGQFGKWHVGDSVYGPGNQGFDVHLPDILDRAGPPQGGYIGWTTPTMQPQPADEHIEDRMRKEVCGFIADHRDEPFFVLYEMFSAHGPWEAKPDLVDDYPSGGPLSPTYGAMVQTLSLNVGGVLNTLEALGLEDETIVIFASDNGGNVHTSAPGECVPVTTNAPLRGGKAMLWEGGIRVPLVIRVPGLTTGTRSTELAQLCDLYPTLCELCDLDPPPTSFDGASLVPALSGQPMPRETIGTFFPHSPGAEFVTLPDRTFAGATIHDRDGFKLLREFHAGPNGAHRERLFDLANDPGELSDVSASNPTRAASLSAALDSFLSQTGAVLPLPNPGYVP